MDFEQKYQKDPGMNRVNLNLAGNTASFFFSAAVLLLPGTADMLLPVFQLERSTALPSTFSSFLHQHRRGHRANHVKILSHYIHIRQKYIMMINRVSQKKRTFWIAVLGNRVWGYMAFQCQLAAQLVTYPQTRFQKVRFLGRPVGIYGLEYKLWS